MYVYMLLHPDPGKYDLSSMRYWISGSAPLTRDTYDTFREKFGAEIIEGWGLTEAGANNSVNPLEGKKKVGSIGLPMKGTHMKILDFDGNELPVGETGEIVISGPMLMKGYWGQTEATAEVIKGGWLHTGDVGHQDDDGYFFITDRIKKGALQVQNCPTKNMVANFFTKPIQRKLFYKFWHVTMNEPSQKNE